MSLSCLSARQPRHHTRRAPRLFSAAATLLALAMLSGCAAKDRTFRPTVEVDRLSDIEFTHYLATVPVASVDEGLRATLLLTGDSTRWPTYHDRRGELVRRGALRDRWRLRKDAVLDIGTLAYLLRDTCSVPRGVNDVLFGSWGAGDRRYALRACTNAGVLPYGRPSDAVTGGQLLAAITAADRYLNRNEPESP